MTESLQVWAPHANTLTARTPDGDLPMQRLDGGWWTTAAPYEGSYAFVVDGDVLPDPRSPWQPEGIRGWSHTVDHESFPWDDHGWRAPPLAGCTIYELHIGTFTRDGTFDAAIERLPHLRDLGIDAVELLPVAEFPGRRGWGYDGVLLFAPHHAYGGPEGLKRFVDAAHAHGLAVVLDVVYNHLGPSGNHLARFGPYFTDRHSTPWGQAVNLDDAGSTETRRFFCDNAIQWLRDYHIDGLRLDAVHALYDQSAMHFLEQLAIEVDQLERATGRQLWLIAESDLNDPRLVRSRDAHGYGLDAAWTDDFHHAVHSFLTGERDGYYEDYGDIALVAHALQHTFVADGRYSQHRQRNHGRAVDVPQDRFVCFLQNHDQVGNRAVGERLTSLVSTDARRAASTLLLLGPFVPLLFQGEEWDATTPFLYFTDHDEPELADAVREGRRSEFAAFEWDPEVVPDPQDPQTHARSVLDWAEPERAAHAEALDWHRALLALRRRMLASLVGRDDRVHVTVHDDRALVMHRGGWVVAVNLSSHSAEVGARYDGDVVLQRGHAQLTDGCIELDPWSVLVLSPRDAHLQSPRGGRGEAGRARG